MAIIPKIEAIVLFFASSDNFDHKYIVKKTINGIPKPISKYFGIF